MGPRDLCPDQKGRRASPLPPSPRRGRRALVLPRGVWQAGEKRRFRVDRFEHVVPVPPLEGSDAALRRADHDRRAYDDPDHPEVVVRLTYRGRRMAESFCASRPAFEETGPDEWYLRFRCPPGELAYYAREITALGADAHIVGPASLRDLVIDQALAVRRTYGLTPHPEENW